MKIVLTISKEKEFKRLCAVIDALCEKVDRAQDDDEKGRIYALLSAHCTYPSKKDLTK